MKITINLAEGKHLDPVKELLQNNTLPIDGVDTHFESFLIALENELHLVGCIGLEEYAPFGLLRSLAITNEYRGHGYGKKLVMDLFDFAKEKGISEIFLLTTTAKEYFKSLDFTIIPREDVPDLVKKSIEFTSACPDSATCMKRKI